MNTKKCIKCGEVKPITEFHKHKVMKDGHRNICKVCACRIERERQFKLGDSAEYREKERKRGRDKYHRLYSDMHKKSSHKENKMSHRDLMALGVNLDGVEVHHWDYNQKRNVFLLSPRAHKRVHRQIVFDEDSKKFSYRGSLLNTKEEHQQAILSILLEYGEVSFESEMNGSVVRVISNI